jgi:hypothetical protein
MIEIKFICKVLGIPTPYYAKSPQELILMKTTWKYTNVIVVPNILFQV